MLVHLLVPKDFTTKKQFSIIPLSQFPWYRWTNLGTSFHKCNSKVFLQFPFGSANLLDVSPWFSASVDFQVFDSGEKILKPIHSSLWSIFQLARACGASVTTDPGEKLENKGLNCQNLITWFWRIFWSHFLCQRVLSTLNLW